MSNKEFLSMGPEERDAEAKKWVRGIRFDETRPMSRRSRALWEIAKRGRGRPPKPGNERPNLLAVVEAFASSKGLDRSKLFAMSVRAFMEADKAIQQDLSKTTRSPRDKRHAAETST